MNPFKKLFKLNDSKTISKNEKMEEQTIHELERPKEEIAEREKKLTEEETNELIERFVKYEDPFDGFDPLLEDAAKIIVKKQVGFSGVLQREMKLGYNRAGKLMKQLILLGIIKSNSPTSSTVLLKTEVELEQFFQNQFHQIESVFNNYKFEIENKIEEHIKQKQQQQADLYKNNIKQELIEREQKKQLQREAYKELQDEGIIPNQSLGNEWRREPIPQDVMDKVWNRDGGRCVKCGSQESLEFDHIIPFSKGGANTYRNLQILCKKCNVAKSNKIG